MLVSVHLRAWQHKDTVCEIGDQVLDALAEEWAAHVRRETALLSEVCSRLYLYEMNLDLRGGILWQKGNEEGQRK